MYDFFINAEIQTCMEKILDEETPQRQCSCCPINVRVVAILNQDGSRTKLGPLLHETQGERLLVLRQRHFSFMRILHWCRCDPNLQNKTNSYFCSANELSRKSFFLKLLPVKSGPLCKREVGSAIQKGTGQIQQVTQVTIAIYMYSYPCTMPVSILIACNEQAAVDKSADIDGSIQVEFIIATGHLFIKLYKLSKFKYQI